jgi:hypothetical protein
MNDHQYLCYGIIDKNNELLLEKDAFSGLAATAESMTEILNNTQNLRDDHRGPYTTVTLYYSKTIKEQA